MIKLRGKFQVKNISSDVDQPGVLDVTLLSEERFKGPNGPASTSGSEFVLLYDSVKLSISDPDVVAAMTLGTWIDVDLTVSKE